MMSFSLNNGCYSLSLKPHRNRVKVGILRRIKIRKKPVIDVDSIFFETNNVPPSGLSEVVGVGMASIISI